MREGPKKKNSLVRGDNKVDSFKFGEFETSAEFSDKKSSKELEIQV